MREERKETLQKLCLAFRSKLIDLLYSIQTGHPG
ncbi:MAG: transketolase, partial [Enterocloster clostridioformis]|nr:transketolase [Enterocloster clostridioformis]